MVPNRPIAINVVEYPMTFTPASEKKREKNLSVGHAVYLVEHVVWRKNIHPYPVSEFGWSGANGMHFNSQRFQ